MSLPRTPLYVAAAVFTFVGLAAVIIFLSRSAIISPELAMLMLVAEVGIYLGTLILVLMFRLVLRLK